jgi:hypothetical protein
MALTFISNETSSRFTALVIGKPGVGKTSLLKTIPEDEPVCTLSAEAGLLCVRDLIQEGRVSGVVINSLDDFKEAVALLKHNTDWQNAYKWVFIDSLSEIASRCADHYKALYTNEKDERNGYKIWDHYNYTMTSLIKDLRDMPHYNVVFTCLEMVEVDECKRRFIRPDMPGKVGTKIESFFDEILYMTIVNDEKGAPQRVFVTQASTIQPGKDRSGKLDPFEVPDLAAIKRKILGEPNDEVSAKP